MCLFNSLTPKLVALWVPTLISVISAIYIILTYRRNSKFVNENLVFKQKIEVYSALLEQLNTLINGLDDISLELKKNFSEETNQERYNIRYDELADRTDALIYNFDDIVVRHSLLIPGKVLKLLNNLRNNLMDSDVTIMYNSSESEEIEDLTKYIDEIICLAEELNTLMREDLNIERLNKSLFKRINK